MYLETVEYVINHSEIPIVVVGANRIPGIIQLAPKVPNLKVIISMDELEDESPVPFGSTTSGKILKAWAEDKAWGTKFWAEDPAPAPPLTQALKPSISSHNAPYWPL